MRHGCPGGLTSGAAKRDGEETGMKVEHRAGLPRQAWRLAALSLAFALLVAAAAACGGEEGETP